MVEYENTFDDFHLNQRPFSTARDLAPKLQLPHEPTSEQVHQTTAESQN